MESDVCNHRRVEIDARWQRLRGCILCNQWMNFDGEWVRLPEQDIAALRGLTWQFHGLEPVVASYVPLA